MESLTDKDTFQLHEAAEEGHEDIVARLLALDPSLVHARYTNGYLETPLHLAAINDYDGVVAQLLALCPSDVRDSTGRTALHLAAREGNDKTVARLLAHNPALINAVSSGDTTALHMAACKGHESTVVQLLSHSPQSSDAKDHHGRTALHIAAANGQYKIVARLLAHNPALIDAVSSSRETALHCATTACFDAKPTVVLLLNHSPGLLSMKTASNSTALHLAAYGGNVKVVAELLARCPSLASLADEDVWGRTPLFRAVMYGHQKVVDLFPLTTDQVHRRDKEGNTLLHLVSVARNLNTALLQRIWEMNPDALFVANEQGWMPFDCAISSVNERAIEYFQWKLSIWSVEEAFVKMMQTSSQAVKEALQRREQSFREVVQGECERPLLSLLPRDCVHLILDYLFISDSHLGGVERSPKRAKAANIDLQ